MPTYRTPDVYIEEISVFPPSVAEVETAIPAFVGHTRTAKRAVADDLRNVPTKIYSFTEFEQYFGLATDQIDVTVTGAAATAVATPLVANETVPPFRLAHAVKMYFDNGGGKCYIVSIGALDTALDAGLFEAGIRAVESQDEPTLLLAPEAVRLNNAGYTTVCQAMLSQCGKLKDRFAILDVLGGHQAVDDFGPARAAWGAESLKYGAAYYPFVKSSMAHFIAEDESNVQVEIDGGAAVALGTLRTANTAVYNAAKAAARECYVTLPASGAVAGVYAATDSARGVWKAPANVGLRNVLSPTVLFDNAKQDGMNVDATSGKSINAIRAFSGKGTLVWGARTLAGNDNEWRYVSVRRFFNMVEESVKKSTYWAVFEPNDANTWVKVRGMIENYLTQKWREGALAGATTKEAFFVRCGLGVTMNAQDILEGRMIVEIGMAVVRPAEFIILKFSHKLQTS